MTTDIASLASPIDALYRIHNALRTEAERAEQTVEHLEVGSSFKAFYPVFYHWALVLSTYVEAEERALTTGSARDAPSVQTGCIPRERRDHVCGEAMGPAEGNPADHA